MNETRRPESGTAGASSPAMSWSGRPSGRTSFQQRPKSSEARSQPNPLQSLAHVVVAGAAFQHSITFTASPPRDVSLYLSFMSAPVSRIVLIALSSDTLWLPSP